MPKTFVNEHLMRMPLPGGGDEPIGNRIIELPQSIPGAESRDPHSGFIAYVPKGSLAKGKEFVNTGGGGKTIQCAICHGTDNFVPTATLNNNGLEFPYVDLGVGGVTGVAAQNGLFKVPSLRNIELTAPYMHDGSVATLEAVIDLYDRGGIERPSRSVLIRPLGLTTDEKADLIAFLNTLTSEPKTVALPAR